MFCVFFTGLDKTYGDLLIKPKLCAYFTHAYLKFQKGDDVMIQPNVSDSEAKACYNNIKTVMLPSGKTYLRIVPQPIDA